MMKLLSRFIFWISGWSLNNKWPEGLKKAVLIAIPHTSNWDILYARAGFFLMDIPVRFTIKKEAMVGPLGWLLRGLGAIAIDRKRIPGGRQQTYTEAMINMLNGRDELVVMVTPEGTRSAVKKMEIRILSYRTWSQCPDCGGLLGLQEKGSRNRTLPLSKRRYGWANRRVKSLW